MSKHWSSVALALARRELRDHRRLAMTATGVILINVLWAMSVGRLPANPVLTDPASFADRTQPMLFGYMMVVAVMLLVVDRLSADREHDWLGPLFAAGFARGKYVVMTVLAAYLSVAFLYVLGSSGYLIVRIAGDTHPHVSAYVGSMVRVGFLLASYGVFAAICALLMRGRLAALGLAALATIGPWSAWLAMGGRLGQDSSVLRLLLVHLPPRPDTLLWNTALDQIAYSAMALVVALLLSRFNVARSA